MGVIHIAGIIAHLFAPANGLFLPRFSRALAKPKPVRLVRLPLIGALTFVEIALALGAIFLAGHDLTHHQIEPTYRRLAKRRWLAAVVLAIAPTRQTLTPSLASR
jgi:hypothetical protein